MVVHDRRRSFLQWRLVALAATLWLGGFSASAETVERQKIPTWGPGPIPIYVTGVPWEPPSACRPLELPEARSLEGFPGAGAVGVYLGVASVHRPSGLRVFQADDMEDAAQYLRRDFEERRRFELTRDPHEAFLVLTVTNATRSVFWDELHFETERYLLEFRLRAGGHEAAGVECLDNLDEWRPWQTIGKRLGDRIEAWLRGETSAGTRGGGGSRWLQDCVRDLKRAIGSNGRFQLVGREEDAELILRAVSRERVSEWFRYGVMYRIYYRVEVPGTTFVADDVEAEATDGFFEPEPWERIAKRIVKNIERWARENEERGRNSN